MPVSIHPRARRQPIASSYSRGEMSKAPAVQLACLQCQQRKRKCNKTSPCSACQHSGITCTPVARTRLPRGRQVRRLDNSGLEERVKRLEKLLSSAKIRHDPARSAPLSNGLKVSDSIWESVDEQVVSIRELLDDLTIDENIPQPSVEDERDDLRLPNLEVALLGHSSILPSLNVLEMPSENIMSTLFDIYMHRINTIFKVVHAPSLYSLMFEDCVSDVTSDALKYATFFTAVSSLGHGECVELLGMEKTSLCARFRSATEVLLCKSKLLTAPSLTALQAFVIYLVFPCSFFHYLSLMASGWAQSL